MFWGKGPDKSSADEAAKKTTASTTATATGSGAKPKAFDDGKPLPATKNLPRDLQNIIDQEDKDDTFYDDLISG